MKEKDDKDSAGGQGRADGRGIPEAERGQNGAGEVLGQGVSGG